MQPRWESGADAARAGDLLAALANPNESRIPAHDVAVVVAHPDDETIGCGAALARLSGVRVIVVTDGAPRDGRDARRCGFATCEDYASAREGTRRGAVDGGNRNGPQGDFALWDGTTFLLRKSE